MSTRFEILILGNSSATPLYDRHPSAQVLNHNGQLFLIDCGEGTQNQLLKYNVRSSRIKHIFISHLHGDHYLGIVGLISSMNLKGRTDDLHLYAPCALEEIIELHLRHSKTILKFPLHFHPTDPHAPQTILETSHLKVSTFPLNHRIDCTGFRFDEIRQPSKLLIDKVESLRIPIDSFARIKSGEDFIDEDGMIHTHGSLTRESDAPRSYAYCSDTIMTNLYWPYIQNVDTLYHESTFLHEMEQRATETFHTTARQAGEIATSVGAKKLLLGHFSARYKNQHLTQLLDEAQQQFKQSKLTVEGQYYPV